MTDAAGAFSCGSLEGGASYLPQVFAGATTTRPLPFVTPAASIEVGAEASVTGVRLVIDPHTIAISGAVLDDVGAPVDGPWEDLAWQSASGPGDIRGVALGTVTASD